MDMQCISYHVTQVKDLGDQIMTIGNGVADEGSKKLPECTQNVCAVWTGENRNYFVKKLNGVALKTYLLGGKIKLVGASVIFSANTILAAEEAVISIIKG